MELVGRILLCTKPFADFKVGERFEIMAHHIDGQIEIYKGLRRVRFSTKDKELDSYSRYFTLEDKSEELDEQLAIKKQSRFSTYDDVVYVRWLRGYVYEGVCIEDVSLYEIDEDLAPHTKFIGRVEIDFSTYKNLLTDYNIDFSGKSGEEIYRYATYVFTKETADTFNFNEQCVVPPEELRTFLYNLVGTDALYNMIKS